MRLTILLFFIIIGYGNSIICYNGGIPINNNTSCHFFLQCENDSSINNDCSCSCKKDTYGRSRYRGDLCQICSVEKNCSEFTTYNNNNCKCEYGYSVYGKCYCDIKTCQNISYDFENYRCTCVGKFDVCTEQLENEYSNYKCEDRYGCECEPSNYLCHDIFFSISIFRYCTTSFYA